MPDETPVEVHLPVSDMEPLEVTEPNKPEQVNSNPPVSAETPDVAAIARPKPFNRRVALAFVYLSVFIDTLGISIFLPILPYYAISFGAGPTEVGWVMASFSLASSVSNLYLGRLSDKCGRRNTILLSILGSAVGWTLFGFSFNLASLIAFRVFCGLFGGTAPVAQAYIASCTTEAERPTYLAFVGSTMGLAFLFGPSVGAGLSQFSLATPFFVAAGFAYIAFAFACVFTPEPPSTNDSERGSQKLLEQEEGEEQKVGLSSLCSAQMAVFLILKFLSTVAISCLINIWALYMDSKFGSGTLTVGFQFSIFSLMLFLGPTFLFPILNRRLGGPLTYTFGSFVAAAGYFVVDLVPHEWAVVAPGIFLMAGVAFAAPVPVALVSLSAPRKLQGSALAMCALSESAGYGLSPIFLTILFARDRVLPFLVTGAVCAVCGVSGVLLHFWLGAGKEKSTSMEAAQALAAIQHDLAHLDTELETLLGERDVSEDSLNEEDEAIVRDMGTFCRTLLTSRNYRIRRTAARHTFFKTLMMAYPPVSRVEAEEVEVIDDAARDVLFGLASYKQYINDIQSVTANITRLQG